jgi:hypothetical protein
LAIEVHGDYWHGNPRKYYPSTIHPSIDKTMGELYIKTLERAAFIRSQTVNGNPIRLIEIWEDVWRLIIKRINVFKRKVKAKMGRMSQ